MVRTNSDRQCTVTGTHLHRTVVVTKKFSTTEMMHYIHIGFFPFNLDKEYGLSKLVPDVSRNVFKKTS